MRTLIVLTCLLFTVPAAFAQQPTGKHVEPPPEVPVDFPDKPAVKVKAPAGPNDIAKAEWNKLWAQKRKESKAMEKQAAMQNAKPRKSYNHPRPVPPIAVYQAMWARDAYLRTHQPPRIGVGPVMWIRR